MLLLVLVALLFFCSGASALMYQVLWRKLGLVFGVTVYAASTAGREVVLLLWRSTPERSWTSSSNHLLLTKKRYDVITADLILPIHAGSGNLCSAEYFTLVRRALRDEGIALQWVWERKQSTRRSCGPS